MVQNPADITFCQLEPLKRSSVPEVPTATTLLLLQVAGALQCSLAELLGDVEGANMSERGLRFLGTIENSAKFAGTLVDNLLSFSQMGRCAMHLSDVNLSAMVASIKLEMLPDYEGRDIRHSKPTLGEPPVL